jgi:triosephosphate isomerase
MCLRTTLELSPERPRKPDLSSAEQLADIGANWTLVGHSERRTLFGETNAVTLEKLSKVMKSSIGVVFCVGETLQQRESGETNNVLKEQLTGVTRKSL